MKFKKIIIADDHPIVRIGVQSFVNQFDENIIVDFASNYEELQFLLIRREHDLLIQDIYFGNKHAADFLKELIDKYEIPVIAISTDDNPNTVKALLEIGIKSFVSKSENLEELVDALRMVEQGETYLSQEMQTKVNKYESVMDSIRLTKRETDILHIAIQEKTNKEIADVLCISEKTVEIHKSNLYAKLGVKNLAGLVKRAYELNLIRK